jgi:hypothetical protein
LANYLTNGLRFDQVSKWFLSFFFFMYYHFTPFLYYHNYKPIITLLLYIYSYSLRCIFGAFINYITYIIHI